MNVYLRSLICVCLAIFAGCGSSGDFKTAKTTGVLLCEGAPVEGAMVYFEPIRSGGGASDSSMVGKQGFSYTDAEGRFNISTYDPGSGDGAVVGKHRVRVGRGKAECPCAMNAEVDLMEVEVKAGTTNEFELVLKKATASEKRAEAQQQAGEEEED